MKVTLSTDLRRRVAGLVLAALAGSAFGVPEEDAAAAEKAGRLREAMALYGEALRGATEGSDRERQLRERILRLAPRVRPTPVVPEQALRFEGRAEAAVAQATTPEDYLNAAREISNAISIAPWQARYYFNLGVVLEKAGRFAEAIRAFELYLVGAPDAADRNEVTKRIAGLEYRAEQSSPAAVAAREREATEALIARLEGSRFVGPWQGGGRFQLYVRNRQLIFGHYDPEIANFGNNPQNLADDFGMVGAQRFALTGRRVTPFSPFLCNAPSTLEFADDGRSATVHRACPDASGNLKILLRRE